MDKVVFAISIPLYPPSTFDFICLFSKFALILAFVISKIPLIVVLSDKIVSFFNSVFVFTINEFVVNFLSNTTSSVILALPKTCNL